MGATFLNRMLAKCENPAICALEDTLLEDKDAAKTKAYVVDRIVSAGNFALATDPGDFIIRLRCSCIETSVALPEGHNFFLELLIFLV